MANHWFQFKQFKINQEKAAFKVGTDAVLLGSWADISGVETALDIGCGTGLLSLMLAQRSDARITAIEIDQSSYRQAVENIEASPWPERIEVLLTSLQDFSYGQKFDLIITNPPFYQDSMLPVDKGRRVSRHDSMLSLEDLTISSRKLLSPRGKYCLVLPLEESSVMEDLCRNSGFHLQRVLSVKPTPNHPVKRILSEYRLSPARKISRKEISIEAGKRHEYTEAYRNICSDFYLAF